MESLQFFYILLFINLLKGPSWACDREGKRARHWFNRANSKLLVLAQATKLCYYTRASQRPSAEGSSLWETVYPLLHVLLPGVSCNMTLGMTLGLRLEKYKCRSRSEGQQCSKHGSKVEPQRQPTMGWTDATQDVHAAHCNAPQVLCAFYAQKKRKKESQCYAENKAYEYLREQCKACSPKN